MKKKLLLGLILFMGVLNAQTEFRSGYIVKQNLDTIYGEIDYRSDAIMAKVCKFKKDEVIIEYNPNELTSYRFTDGKYFVSYKNEGTSVFLQFLFEGKLNVYYLYDSNRERYFLKKEDGEIREVLYDEKLVEKNGAFYLKESTIHYGYLSEFTKDAPELKSQIYEMKVLNNKNMISLAKNYQNSFSDSKEVVAYTVESRKPKYSLELRGGVVYHTDVERNKSLTNSNSFHLGVLLHTSIPYFGDKWYFKTGVMASKLEFLSESSTFYRAPLHLEYIYFRGVVRPRISYGVDFSNEVSPSPSLDLGVNIEISEKLFISLGTEFLFTSSVVIIPNDIYGYTMNGGVFYKL